MAKTINGSGSGFDFSDFTTSDEPAEMHLTHPSSGDELLHGGEPIRVWIYGPDTARMKAFEDEIGNKRLRAVQNTGGRIRNLDAAQIRQERQARVVHCIAKWDNFWRDGQKIEHTPAEARDFATKFPWFLDQVDEFYQNRGNFWTAEKKQLKPSAAASEQSST